MMEETTTLPKTYRIGGPGYGYNTLTTKTVGVNAPSKSPIVSLSVGPGKALFYAQEELLSLSSISKCAHSDVFRKRVTKQIALPEEDPEVIGHMLDYLQSGTYLTCDTEDGNDLAELLAKIYVMADRYNLYELRLLTVEYFAEVDCLRLLNEEYFLKISHHIYEKTDGDLVYNEFFVDTACKWFKDEKKSLHAYVEPYLVQGGAFAFDLYQAQLQVSTQRKNIIDSHGVRDEIDDS